MPLILQTFQKSDANYSDEYRARVLQLPPLQRAKTISEILNCPEAIYKCLDRVIAAPRRRES